jgi:hypothetical protein
MNRLNFTEKKLRSLKVMVNSSGIELVRGHLKCN